MSNNVATSKINAVNLKILFQFLTDVVQRGLLMNNVLEEKKKVVNIAEHI